MPTINNWYSQDPAQVAKGGTGIATTTAYAPICGGTTATGAFQAASTGLATSGYVLTSNGAAAVPSFKRLSGTSFIQSKYTISNTQITVNSNIPKDNTIPQKTEGVEIITCTITPTSATNILIIKVNLHSVCDNLTDCKIALFQDATDGALSARLGVYTSNAKINNHQLFHAMVAGTTSATTFKIRVGTEINSLYTTFTSFGAVSVGFMEVSEYAP